MPFLKLLKCSDSSCYEQSLLVKFRKPADNTYLDLYYRGSFLGARDSSKATWDGEADWRNIWNSESRAGILVI